MKQKIKTPEQKLDFQSKIIMRKLMGTEIFSMIEPDIEKSMFYLKLKFECRDLEFIEVELAVKEALANYCLYNLHKITNDKENFNYVLDV